jgi:hypothetical protein
VCIYVFCVNLRTNNYYFPIQHYLTGFYNAYGPCLLFGWAESLNIRIIKVNLSLQTVNQRGHMDIKLVINRLAPNDTYMSRTAPLTSKRCILYIYSTDISTEYFKHALYSPFFSLQNAVCFIMLTCLVPVLFTFYIQGVLKLKKIIPAPKG